MSGARTAPSRSGMVTGESAPVPREPNRMTVSTTKATNARAGTPHRNDFEKSSADGALDERPWIGEPQL